MDKSRIEIIQTDITKLNVDAIVNAANPQLAGGGGVDGAIHRAAGPELIKECRTLYGCPTGSAKITKAYKLPAKYVIHAVGPVWRGGNSNEDKLLKSCYISCLEIVKYHQLKTMAFSNISTGIYGFPKERAAKIAIEATKEFMATNGCQLNVFFVCFDDESYNIYSRLLQ